MINRKDNPVEYALMGLEFEEMLKHLDELTNKFASQEAIDENHFKIDIAHLYAHLNRIYNGRNHIGEISDEDFTEYSKFPIDIEPIG